MRCAVEPLSRSVRLVVSLASGGIWLAAAPGCGLRSGRIELDLVSSARLALAELQRVPPPPGDEDLGPWEPRKGSVVVGELLAIFPGLLVHGLGHYCAGDYSTAARLRHVGELGYLLTAAGGGLGAGAYFLDQADQEGFAYGLYATGGAVALAGVTYFFTAWIYDMIDTPRAVRTGGEPPPRSEFIEALDLFD
ncbi:MAG: hypothetical protein HY721_13565 [Planctomycetes bacterium]|nr:hypothetical protein [Planctomycetota bacterium]